LPSANACSPGYLAGRQALISNAQAPARICQLDPLPAGDVQDLWSTTFNLAHKRVPCCADGGRRAHTAHFSPSAAAPSWLSRTRSTWPSLFVGVRPRHRRRHRPRRGAGSAMRSDATCRGAAKLQNAARNSMANGSSLRRSLLRSAWRPEQFMPIRCSPVPNASATRTCACATASGCRATRPGSRPLPACRRRGHPCRRCCTPLAGAWHLTA
jgi:hypothetical protein